MRVVGVLRSTARLVSNTTAMPPVRHAPAAARTGKKSSVFTGSCGLAARTASTYLLGVE
jgi:hypothetical protein